MFVVVMLVIMTVSMGMVMVVLAMSVIMTAIRIMLMFGPAPLQIADQHEEKAGQQDECDENQRFHNWSGL